MSNAVIRGLMDTPVMAAWVAGHAPATLFFIGVNRLFAPPISQLTAAALLAGCSSDADRALALRFISFSHVVELTDKIAQRAINLLTAIPLPTVLTASDAIIAATAIEHSLPLDTLDPARFANLSGLAAIQAY